MKQIIIDQAAMEAKTYHQLLCDHGYVEVTNIVDLRDEPDADLILFLFEQVDPFGFTLEV